MEVNSTIIIIIIALPKLKMQLAKSFVKSIAFFSCLVY